jgi:ABC-type nickel/cobalt efflux system permease component RcnA
MVRHETEVSQHLILSFALAAYHVAVTKLEAHGMFSVLRDRKFTQNRAASSRHMQRRKLRK